MVFQNYALFPHLTVDRNVSFGLEQRKTPKDEIDGPGPPGAGDGPAQAGCLFPPDAGPALRGAAAAGRARPGAGAGARHPSAGRAARRHRPQAAEGDAARAQGAEQAARHHLRLRHPRPGRSAHHVRPHCGHGQRAGRAAGNAGGDLRESADRVRGQVHRRVELLRGAGATGGNGDWELEWEYGGSARLPSHPSLEKGKRVRIAVRPEWMDVWRPDAVPPGENALAGTIEDIIYLGETMHVHRPACPTPATSPSRCGTRASSSSRCPGSGAMRRPWPGSPRIARSWRRSSARDPRSGRWPGCTPGRRRRAWALLAPGGLWLLVFFLIPILIMLVYSLMPRGIYGGVEPRLHPGALSRASSTRCTSRSCSAPSSGPSPAPSSACSWAIRWPTSSRAAGAGELSCCFSWCCRSGPASWSAPSP